jgi:hypothetical protein
MILSKSKRGGTIKRKLKYQKGGDNVTLGWYKLEQLDGELDMPAIISDNLNEVTSKLKNNSDISIYISVLHTPSVKKLIIESTKSTVKLVETKAFSDAVNNTNLIYNSNSNNTTALNKNIINPEYSYIVSNVQTNSNSYSNGIFDDIVGKSLAMCDISNNSKDNSKININYTKNAFKSLMSWKRLNFAQHAIGYRVDIVNYIINSTKQSSNTNTNLTTIFKGYGIKNKQLSYPDSIKTIKDFGDLSQFSNISSMHTSIKNHLSSGTFSRSKCIYLIKAMFLAFYMLISGYLRVMFDNMVSSASNSNMSLINNKNNFNDIGNTKTTYNHIFVKKTIAKSINSCKKLLTFAILYVFNHNGIYSSGELSSIVELMKLSSINDAELFRKLINISKEESIYSGSVRTVIKDKYYLDFTTSDNKSSNVIDISKSRERINIIIRFAESRGVTLGGMVHIPKVNECIIENMRSHYNDISSITKLNLELLKLLDYSTYLVSKKLIDTVDVMIDKAIRKEKNFAGHSTLVDAKVEKDILSYYTRLFREYEKANSELGKLKRTKSIDTKILVNKAYYEKMIYFNILRLLAFKKRAIYKINSSYHVSSSVSQVLDKKFNKIDKNKTATFIAHIDKRGKDIKIQGVSTNSGYAPDRILTQSEIQAINALPIWAEINNAMSYRIFVPHSTLTGTMYLDVIRYIVDGETTEHNSMSLKNVIIGGNNRILVSDKPLVGTDINISKEWKYISKNYKHILSKSNVSVKYMAVYRLFASSATFNKHFNKPMGNSSKKKILKYLNESRNATSLLISRKEVASDLSQLGTINGSEKLNFNISKISV